MYVHEEYMYTVLSRIEARASISYNDNWNQRKKIKNQKNNTSAGFELAL